VALDALIFDLDGTLLDTSGAHVRSYARAFERCGYRVHADRVRVEIGEGSDDLVSAILGREAAALCGDDVRAAAGEEFLRIARTERFSLFDGALDLLGEARRRGLRLALATPATERHLDAAFASAGADLRERVDEVVSASDAERTEPRASVVAAAVHTLALCPAQCAMIGDAPADATAARRAGVVTLGVLSGGTGDERALVSAGARRVWRDVGHLRQELDEALHVASPGAARLTSELLDRLMREALAAARDGMAAGEAPIGCVVADGGGGVIASGYNEMNRTQNKTAHAEIVAFAKAAGRAPLDARDLLLVSTLEPCVMCTGAAMEGAVDTIVFGLRAPADSGTGRVRPPESPESQMPRIVGDVLAGECRALFEEWLAEHQGEPQAAYVEQLLALTAEPAR
jgi:phosphoglycolate phosphatase-like HAD superfamily hydrolase/tRNA(Arg) A34 adenosine deaminase TadA